RSSANGVNPTKSANRTLTTRRSATASAAATGAAGTAAKGRGAVGAGGGSGVAQVGQKFAPGRVLGPPFWQPPTSGDAHSSQNLAPATFCVPQLLQIKVGLPLDSTRPARGGA